LLHIPGGEIKCPRCGSEDIAISPRMHPRNQQYICYYAPWRPQSGEENKTKNKPSKTTIKHHASKIKKETHSNP
jgi:hypothetical protein